MNKWRRYADELAELQAKGLYRTINVLESAQSSHVRYQGRDMLMLASNAYLDMCSDPEVKAAAAAALAEFGVGSGGSRLLTGTATPHARLEQTLARFKGREAALVFNSGFAANSGIIPALTRAGDHIFSDELNHASIIDGCRQSKAQTVIYRHNDMADLAAKLAASGAKSGLIVSDAVFSMDGDIADLPELHRLAEQSGLLLMLDEAHATGVIGARGRGIEEHFNMPGSVDVLMGTLSKAFGAEGGYVCGSAVLIDYLRNKARSFIFSTSLSPAVMAAAGRAVELLEQQPERAARLQQNVRVFTAALHAKGVAADSQTAIIPIFVGDEERALAVSKRLFDEGYYISAIRYPTVKRGEAILRAALMSSHTEAELEQAASAIAAALA